LSKNAHLSKADKLSIINTIVIFMRMSPTGLIDNKYIIAFLKRNNVVNDLSDTTLLKYIGQAKKIVRADFHTSAWFTEKVQDSMMKDYMGLWIDQDSIITNLKKQLKGMIDHAKIVADQAYPNEDRYQEFIDREEFRKTNLALSTALKEKMEMMKGGLIQYKINQYIQSLQQGKPNPELTNDPIIQSLDRSPLVTEPKALSDKEKQEEKQNEPDGFILADHLKPFEEKLNKKLSSLQE
jgi:hypothetical protein